MDTPSDSHQSEPHIEWPDWFTKEAEVDFEWKGYAPDIIVVSPNGERYSVMFMEPVRVQTELNMRMTSYPKRPVVVESGLLVVPEITREAMEVAVQIAWAEGFFERLRPLAS